MYITKAVLTSLIVLMPFSSVLASTITYDLAQDWKNNSNPNGTWAYLQGSSVLPYQASLAAVNSGNGGITSGYAPSDNSGNFLPAMFKATGTGPGGYTNGYMAGDIVVHSVDGGNGDPALGLATITWTSPASGTITLSGGVWYAQPTVDRSDDFVLTDSATNTILASGTVSYSNGFDRLHPDTFSSTAPLSISKGDVIALTLAATAGQVDGSFSGVNLTINETSNTPPATPEPASFGLLLAAFPILGMLVRRSAKRFSDRS